jgi:hypothetical protein
VKIMLSGESTPTAGTLTTSGMDAAEQLAALAKPLARQSRADAATLDLGNLKIADRQMVLFPNGFKAEAPDKDRPDYWGGYNPGDGTPIIRVSAWLKKDRNNHAYLSGKTQYPIPGKSELEQQDAKPTRFSDKPIEPFYGGETKPRKSRRAPEQDGR